MWVELQCVACDNILHKLQNSIMHYGKSYFSKTKGKPTLTPRMPGIKLGQRKALSQTDCLKVNDLYGCLDGDKPKLMKKYYTLCRVLGYWSRRNKFNFPFLKNFLQFSASPSFDLSTLISRFDSRHQRSSRTADRKSRKWWSRRRSERQSWKKGFQFLVAWVWLELNRNLQYWRKLRERSGWCHWATACWGLVCVASSFQLSVTRHEHQAKPS